MRFVDLWLWVFEVRLQIPVGPKLDGTFTVSKVLRAPVKVASVSVSCSHLACECECKLLTPCLRVWGTHIALAQET